MRSTMTFALALLVTACGGGGEAGSPATGDGLEEFEQRQRYTALDPQTLAAIPDGKLEQAIFDYAAGELDAHGGSEAQAVESLAPGVRALYLTWIVESEVNNGGFGQYYANTGGELAEASVAAFDFFGATEHAALMRDANQAGAGNEAALSALDDRFFSLTENLSALRIGKVRAAPELFLGS